MLEPPAEYGPGLVETGENRGIGASFNDPAQAFTKSVFEAFERKWSKVYDPDLLSVAPLSALDAAEAVSPRAFGTVTDWEHRRNHLSYIPWSADLPLGWTQGWRVQPGIMEPALLPATFVFARYGWKNPHEHFAPMLSAGLAAHSTYRAAYLNGLYELIERDAFMLFWLHRKSPPRIERSSVAFDEASEAMDYLDALGFEPHFLDLTTDVEVPVIVTVLEHPDLDWGCTLVPGLGCDLDPIVALKKSLLEAMNMLSNFVTFDQELQHVEPIPLERIHGVPRAEYYREARFLIEGLNHVSIGEIPNKDRCDKGRNLEIVLQRLEELGLVAYLADLTPAEAAPASLVLVRAMVAGLQPMVYEPDCWRFVASRLFADSADGDPDFGCLNLLPNLLMATV
jgi:ribosomal protein S12 methylthiotransferase accessory factor